MNSISRSPLSGIAKVMLVLFVVVGAIRLVDFIFYGRELRGFPAWVMHRTYHLTRMPTFNKKTRILMDWTLGLFFPREIISLGAIEEPRKEFTLSARS